ncbi:hypothetical protein MMC14_003422 [Varicellaria rhodocarpa]|nr:hypothetical protein [Varicellaria rhodocarpa]
MQDLSPIKLDMTLADLYRKSSGDGDQLSVAMIACVANSELDLNPSIPRNTKYVYQDDSFNSLPKDHSSSSHYKETQRQSAVKYLALIPQRDAFVSGDMKVIIFNTDQSDERTSYSREEAERTMNELDLKQRPQLLVLPSPGSISLEENGIDLLVSKMVLDGFDGYPFTIDLETLYFLNTKEALCTSGLSTPNCVLIEVEGSNPEAQTCCGTCSSSTDSISIPASCSGARGKWLSCQISYMTSRVAAHPLPFVFKNQQAYAGGGTIMVSSAKQKEQLIDNLTNRILPKLLSLINSSNAHLKPATLLLSDLVESPINDYGITFFVTKSGECIFIGVTEQRVDPNNAWIGNKISYLEQDKLRSKFEKIMQEIGAWLHGYGYYGPVGADILETAPPNGTQGFFHIVDLNVRTSGSLALGLLKGHFSGERGLHEASSFAINVRMGREEFITLMADRYRERRILIVSWYEDKIAEISYAHVIVGAEDKRRLEKEMELVKEHATEMHF